jgi:hypothetical protein
MAIVLQDEERQALESVLGDAEAIGRDPFGLARQLCDLVNAHGGAAAEFPTDIQDLLIRARAQRNAFGPAIPIIDGLVRERGLFPYLQEARLGVADQLALEMHRPVDFAGDTVFHRAQARVYHLLLRGENVALSAPTSFGKSLIVDAVIAEGRHEKVAVIVPTIALIDETRRRLFTRFGDRYKIITHVGQRPAERTIFVLTPERVAEMDGIDDVTFFAIDEFYKLDPRIEPERSGAMNEALYRLHTRKAQFFLLGPNINELPAAFTAGYQCHFERTDFATVATEVIRVYASPESRPAELARIVTERTANGEPTLIYCRSPESARTVARELARSLDRPTRDEVTDVVEWAAANYHPEWGFVEALSRGIGLHHGPMPRALQQFVARAFNNGGIDVLVCTSTLIEGVNTSAKNVIIYDHSIGNNRSLDYFTYQNIKGRSGRMGRHFIGRVYIFSDPPLPTQLHVDVPVATQNKNAPDSLLIQLDYGDLSDDARERVRPYYEQSLVPVFVLRENHGIDPAAQLRLAAHIRDNAEALWPFLSWSTASPTWEQVERACSLLWEYLVQGRPPRGARTASQLAFFVRRFSAVPDIRALIETELENQAEQDEALDPDSAVETTLDFLRNWANYHFPRYLMAVSRIQEVVFRDADLPPGDYSAYARLVENYFLPPGIAAMDEYGIPLQVGRKLVDFLGGASELDASLSALRDLDLRRVDLTPFERELVLDALQFL